MLFFMLVEGEDLSRHVGTTRMELDLNFFQKAVYSSTIFNGHAGRTLRFCRLQKGIYMCAFALLSCSLLFNPSYHPPVDCVPE